MRLTISVLCLACLGCGPMLVPMVPRLCEKQQKDVDDAWNNMFSPPGRLGRTLLLDVVLSHWYYQYGVDRLHLISEKRVGGGLVVMEIYFDQARPALDAFTVTYYDKDGVERRRERYSRADIEHRNEAIGRAETIAHARTDEMDAEHREEFQSCQRKCIAWLEEIRAATQPSSRPVAPPGKASE
jgi:hypothetical protein